MVYSPITTHVADAVATLTSAYKERPKAEGLVAAIAQQVQELEDAIAQVNTARLLYGGAAVGAQLDVLGTLVGCARAGLDDATYTALIYGTIAKNSSDATCESLINVASLIWQTGSVAVQTPNSPNHSRISHPATVQLAVGSPKTSSSINPKLVSIAQQTLGAAVGIAYVNEFAADGVFACAGPQPWVRGLCDLNTGLGGGPCASLMYTNPLG
jgi:hypothetical protein